MHFIIEVKSSCVLFWISVRAVRPVSSSQALTSGALDRRRSPPAPSIAADRTRRVYPSCSHFPSLPPSQVTPVGSRRRSSDEPLIHSFPEPTPPSPTREATSSSSTCINFFTPDLRCKCLALSNLFWSLVHIVPIGVGFHSGLGYVMWGLGFIVSESCDEISIGFC